jgi:hypothetical protein
MALQHGMAFDQVIDRKHDEQTGRKRQMLSATCHFDET